MNGMVPHVQIAVFTDVTQLLRIKVLLLLPLEADSDSKLISAATFLGLLQEQNMAQVNTSLWRNPHSHSINTISPPNPIKITIYSINLVFLTSSGFSQLHP